MMKCTVLLLALVSASAGSGAGAMQLAQNQVQGLPAANSVTDNLQDALHFRSGVWTAYAAPWGGAMKPLGSGQYRLNTDYRQGGTRGADFPHHTVFHWTWPDAAPGKPRAPGCASVCAYNSIAYCDYFRTKPQTPCPAKRVSDIRQLTSSYAYKLDATPNGADVIYDFFLVDGPASDKRLAEFEIAAQAPKGFADYMARSKPLPDATLCGKPFKVAYSDKERWPIYMMIPADGQPVTSCTMDLLSVLKMAVAQGVVQPDWWLTGLAFGAEPAFGSGRLEIQSLDVTYN